MRFLPVLIAAGAALMVGLVPAPAMPVATVVTGDGIAPVIPIAQGCGPGAYRVGGVCRASSGPVIRRNQGGVLTSNAKGCTVYRPRPFGRPLRFCG